MAALYNLAWVCGRSLAGIAGLSSAGEHGSLSLLSVVCCQAEVFTTGRSLVQRSPTECVSECDREASTMLPWSTRGCCAVDKEKYFSALNPNKRAGSVFEALHYNKPKNTYSAQTPIKPQSYSCRCIIFMFWCWLPKHPT